MSNENALEGLSVSFAGEPLDSALLLGLVTTPDSCTYAALKGSPETILARLSDCAAAAELTLSVGEEKAPAAGRVDAYLTWLCLMNGPASSARSPVRQQPIRVGGTYVGKALTSYSVDSVVQVRLFPALHLTSLAHARLARLGRSWRSPWTITTAAKTSAASCSLSGRALVRSSFF